MQIAFMDAIKTFEGFKAQADWDYAQYSNGYGTKAQFPGEVINKSQADQRFRGEISKAQQIVDAQLPNLDEGTRAAMTSLTFNAGTAWVNAGLGDALRAGDLETARSIFQQYNKAGGQVLPGLVERRTIEASWIGTSPVATSKIDPNQRVNPGSPVELGQSSGVLVKDSNTVSTVSGSAERERFAADTTHPDSATSPLRFNRLPTSIDWQTAADLRFTVNLDYSLRNQDRDDSENKDSWRDNKMYL